MRKITQDPLKLRLASGQNQSDFWRPLGVSQSSGSRIERKEHGLPRPVAMLIALSTGDATVEQLRSGELAGRVANG